MSDEQSNPEPIQVGRFKRELMIALLNIKIGFLNGMWGVKKGVLPRPERRLTGYAGMIYDLINDPDKRLERIYQRRLKTFKNAEDRINYWVQFRK